MREHHLLEDMPSQCAQAVGSNCMQVMNLQPLLWTRNLGLASQKMVATTMDFLMTKLHEFIKRKKQKYVFLLKNLNSIIRRLILLSLPCAICIIQNTVGNIEKGNQDFNIHINLHM